MTSEVLLSLWMLASVAAVVVAMRAPPPFRIALPQVALAFTWQLQARLVVATALPGLVPASNGWHGVSLAWLVAASATSAGLAGVLAGKMTTHRALALLAVPEVATLAALGGATSTAPLPVAVLFITLFVAAVVPATSLLFDTALARNVGRRSLLQGVVAFGLFGFVLPDIVLRGSGATWPAAQDIVTRVPVLLPGVVLYALAAREFARRGNGTPYPFDPPSTLVTSGPYAAVANPMQIAVCLFLLGMGFVAGSVPVGLAAAGALFQYRAFANACSGSSRLGRTREFRDYRARVHAWRPRLTPLLGIPDGLLDSFDTTRPGRHPVRGLRAFTFRR